MSLSTRRDCGRKAFVQDNLPKSTKGASLSRVTKEALATLSFDPIHSTNAEIRSAVAAAFAAKAEKMLDFEEKSEKERLIFLVERWANYEKQQNDWRLLATNLTETVVFAGETFNVKIDALVQRVDHLEAIKFRYSTPALKYRGRTVNTAPSKNPELMILELAGEQAAQKLGFTKAKTPVFASYYHFKGCSDTSKELKLEYDYHPGDNIISYYFAPSERADLEKEFLTVKSDAGDTTCDPSDCKDCICNDLCNLEFVPHKLEEQEDVELRKINELYLTPNQQKFVEHTNGYLRVNAVAGSGKTTVVTLRTLSLIEEGTKPENILMVTFTDKAKNEMKQRLRAYAEGAALAEEKLDISGIQVETFNSWGQKLVEANYQALGFTNPPELVDDIVKKDIIVSLLDVHPNLPFDYRNPFMDTVVAEGAVTAMVKIIDALKSCHAESIDDVMGIGNRHITGRSVAGEILDMYNAYNDELIRLNMVDYEDQLRLLLKLNNLGLFKQMPYEHIIVDEFQDSDKNQIDVLVQLAAASTNLKSLVVVGDELQSIYGFRNSTPENLVTFNQYFPAMEDIPLADNFRSETPIIALANHIIRNVSRLNTQIVTNSKERGIDPYVALVKTQDEEDLIFLNKIEALLNNGTAPSDIAVLCKTRNELIHFQKVFDQAGIPTLLRVPKVVGDEPYVKAIIALANFLRDENDLLDLALYAKAMGQDPFDLTTLEASKQAILGVMTACTSEEDKIAAFMQLIEPLRIDYVGDSFAAKMEKKGFHTLDDYTSYCTKYKLYNTKETISSTREEADCVSLITVHSAKGLEWENVFLSLRRFKYSQEEERLLYVAVTRAKKRLVVTRTDKQNTFARLLQLA